MGLPWEREKGEMEREIYKHRQYTTFTTDTDTWRTLMHRNTITQRCTQTYSNITTHWKHVSRDTEEAGTQTRHTIRHKWNYKLVESDWWHSLLGLPVVYSVVQGNSLNHIRVWLIYELKQTINTLFQSQLFEFGAVFQGRNLSLFVYFHRFLYYLKVWII